MNPTPQKILLFGHRGAAAEAPENTLAGFRLAQQAGMDGIELDVSLCRSGEAVVAHDLTLERLTGRKGAIKQLDYSELKKLEVGGPGGGKWAGERIPRLEEVLDAFGPTMWLDVEIKGKSFASDGVEAKVVSLLRERRLVDNVILSTFNPMTAVRLRAAAPEYQVGFNYLRDKFAPLRAVWFRPLAAPYSLHPQPGQVDETFMRYAHRIGARVMPWGINEPDEIKRCLALGVSGLISDWPSRLKAHLG